MISMKYVSLKDFTTILALSSPMKMDILPKWKESPRLKHTPIKLTTKITKRKS